MDPSLLQESFYALFVKTAAVLPQDVQLLLKQCTEISGSQAEKTLQVITKNIHLAATSQHALCQDTGYPHVLLRCPPSQRNTLEQHLREAASRCAQEGILRHNCVDAVSGRNLGGVGTEFPCIYWEESTERSVCLMLKGGGSENQTTQLTLPDKSIGAERNLEGVYRAVLAAVHTIQGQGCAPGALSVVIGGDRALGLSTAKRQFFDSWLTPNPVPTLAALEARILKGANSLNIGPMGLGGHSTLYAARCTGLCRHPASFFVSIGYMCWAWRRHGISLSPTGSILNWLF